MSADSQRREFVRVNASLPVRYKYFPVSPGAVDDRVHEGMTANLSAGGLLLKGPLPLGGRIEDLLRHRVAVGFSLRLPDEEVPIKALGRVAWIEAPGPVGDCTMGLIFKEIAQSHCDKLVQFIIRSQIP